MMKFILVLVSFTLVFSACKKDELGTGNSNPSEQNPGSGSGSGSGSETSLTFTPLSRLSVLDDADISNLQTLNIITSHSELSALKDKIGNLNLQNYVIDFSTEMLVVLLHLETKLYTYEFTISDIEEKENEILVNTSLVDTPDSDPLGLQNYRYPGSVYMLPKTTKNIRLR